MIPEKALNQYNRLSTPFVIMDAEFTAWEGSWENNWSRPGEHREIIQIAAAIVDPASQYGVQSEFDKLIKPSINPLLSDYIQNLMGISQELIDHQGLNFIQAIKKFYEFCKKGNLIVYCWGSDEDKFIETCRLNGINFSDYFDHFYDIRHVFEKAGIDTSNYQSGTVYKSMQLSLQHKQHYAMNDVMSMVLTLQNLNQKNLIEPSFFLDCPLSLTEM